MKPFDDNALRALIGTDEALILGFHLDASAAEFELVCESWRPDAPAIRAFSLFRFSGVEQFKRRFGAVVRSRIVTTTFLARDERATWVMQGVRSEQADELSRVDISMGHNYGGIEFRYRRLTHELIGLYPIAKGVDRWDYFEVGTNRPVDFYNPCGLPWAATDRR
jgi:hypothetical protein